MALFDDIYEGLNKTIEQNIEDENLTEEIKKEINNVNVDKAVSGDCYDILKLLKYTIKVIKKGKVDIKNCKINITIRNNDGSILLKGSNKRYRRRFR